MGKLRPSEDSTVVLPCSGLQSPCLSNGSWVDPVSPWTSTSALFGEGRQEGSGESFHSL